VSVAFFISNKFPPTSALFPQSFTLTLALIFTAVIYYNGYRVNGSLQTLLVERLETRDKPRLTAQLISIESGSIQSTNTLNNPKGEFGPWVSARLSRKTLR
jgi:hypothetical protein